MKQLAVVMSQPAFLWNSYLTLTNAASDLDPRDLWPQMNFYLHHRFCQALAICFLFLVRKLKLVVKHPLKHLASSPNHLSSIYEASDRHYQMFRICLTGSVRCFVYAWQMHCAAWQMLEGVLHKQLSNCLLRSIKHIASGSGLPNIGRCGRTDRCTPKKWCIRVHHSWARAKLKTVDTLYYLSQYFQRLCVQPKNCQQNMLSMCAAQPGASKMLNRVSKRLWKIFLFLLMKRTWNLLHYLLSVAESKWHHYICCNLNLLK